MSKLTTDYPQLKIDEIRKNLPFIEKKSCTFQFYTNTKNVFSVTIFYTGKTLLLDYQLKESWTYHIKLTKQKCNFGKHRYWLTCPVKRCRKPVSALYLKHEIFACRTCHELLYPSQMRQKFNFPLYRLERIEKQLQGKWSINGAPPRKPKGMHQKTYERLCGLYLFTLLEIKCQGERNLSTYKIDKN